MFGHAAPAVGEHHCQIAERLARILRRAPLALSASAHDSASVSRTRSATSGNSAVPARDESPLPSAAGARGDPGAARSRVAAGDRRRQPAARRCVGGRADRPPRARRLVGGVAPDRPPRTSASRRPDACSGRAAGARVETAVPRRMEQCVGQRSMPRSLLSWTRSASRRSRGNARGRRLLSRGCDSTAAGSLHTARLGARDP
jgi:hypothetical protein